MFSSQFIQKPKASSDPESGQIYFKKGKKKKRIKGDKPQRRVVRILYFTVNSFRRKLMRI